MVIPAASTEYLTLAVTAAPEGVDLTGTAPRFAILASGPTRLPPQDDDWVTGEWVTETEARVLVGPAGGIALEEGLYRVWVNIDPPGAENVVLLAPAPLHVV